MLFMNDITMLAHICWVGFDTPMCYCLLFVQPFKCGSHSGMAGQGQGGKVGNMCELVIVECECHVMSCMSFFVGCYWLLVCWLVWCKVGHVLMALLGGI